jgi:D-sedoheptulose 7-phosphate isomerase
VSPVIARLDELALAVEALRGQSGTVTRWAQRLARRLPAGARLLAAGNGGSAAEAQHLTAELVGRFDGDRRPFSALALHSDTSSLTAIGNDYGYEAVFARQVQAHARPRDILVLLSTSGRSPNLLAAASAGRSVGASVWALTGPLPNPLAELAEDVVTVPGSAATVQEAHLIAVHLLCAAFESALSILDESALSILDESALSILDESAPSILDESAPSILDESAPSILDESARPACDGLARPTRDELARPNPDGPARPIRDKNVSTVRRRRAS